VDATPALVEISRRLNELKLEAVLIGNAARRPRDLAMIDILEKALEETSRTTNKAGGRRARK